MLAAEKNGSWLRVVVKFLLTNQTKDDDYACNFRSRELHMQHQSNPFFRKQ